MSLDRRITKSRVAQLSISAVPNICANQQHEKTRKVYKIIKFYVRTQICISFCKPNCYKYPPPENKFKFLNIAEIFFCLSNINNNIEH